MPQTSSTPSRVNWEAANCWCYCCMQSKCCNKWFMNISFIHWRITSLFKGWSSPNGVWRTFFWHRCCWILLDPYCLLLLLKFWEQHTLDNNFWNGAFKSGETYLTFSNDAVLDSVSNEILSNSPPGLAKKSIFDSGRELAVTNGQKPQCLSCVS